MLYLTGFEAAHRGIRSVFLTPGANHAVVSGESPTGSVYGAAAEQERAVRLQTPRH